MATTDELIGPQGPLNPTDPTDGGWWAPMDCTRCGRPITAQHVWFMEDGPDDVDGPVFHADCIVG